MMQSVSQIILQLNFGKISSQYYSIFEAVLKSDVSKRCVSEISVMVASNATRPMRIEKKYVEDTGVS